MNNDKGMPAGGNSRFRGYPARMSERQQLALILQMTSQDAQQSGSNRSELNANFKLNQQKTSKKGWAKSDHSVQKKGDFKLRQVGSGDYEAHIKESEVSGTEETSNKINSKSLHSASENENQILKTNEETDKTLIEYRLNNQSNNYPEDKADNILINSTNIEESDICSEMRKTPPQNKVDRSATGQSGSSPRVTLRLNQIRGTRDDKKSINSRQNVSGLNQGQMEGLKSSSTSAPSSTSIDSSSSGGGGNVGLSSSATLNANNDNQSLNQSSINSGNNSANLSSDNNDVYEFKNMKEATPVRETGSPSNPASLDKDKEGKSTSSSTSTAASSTAAVTTTTSAVLTSQGQNNQTTTTTTAIAATVPTSSSSSKRTYEGDSNDDQDEENRKKKRKDSEAIKDVKSGSTLRQSVGRTANASNEKSENKTVSSVTSSFVEQSTKSGKQGSNATGKSVNPGSNTADRRSPNAISIPNSPKSISSANLGSKGGVNSGSSSNTNANNSSTSSNSNMNTISDDEKNGSSENNPNSNDDDINVSNNSTNSSNNTCVGNINSNSSSNTINNSVNSGSNPDNAENDGEKSDKNQSNSDCMNTSEGGNGNIGTTVTTESDGEDDRSKSTDAAPKVPPLKIVIPQSTTSEQEQGVRSGKSTSTRGHQLPYVVPISNNSDSTDKDQSQAASGTTSPTETVADGKSEDKKEFSGPNHEERSTHHQRVLRSSHRSGNGNGSGQSKDSAQFNSSNNYPNSSPLLTNNSGDRSTNSSPQQQQRHNSPTPESSNSESNAKTIGSNVVSESGNNNSTVKTNSSGEKSEKSNENSGKNSKDGNETSENISNSNNSSNNSSVNSNSNSATPTVELHPRKRKIKPNKEAQQAASTTSINESNETVNSGPEVHPHDQPITNCYQSILEIRKQIERRRKGLFPVQPKPPQGFRDYLMNRCTYVLASNANKEPNINPPVTLQGAMKELYIDQEKERYRLRMQHVVEKEKLVLSVEQEILRVHGRAARALANQSLPFSACTILKDEEVYNVITPEQEEKDRNARSRYNGRLFLSWLQDVDDKWEKIKEAMLLRHHNEAESLHAVQRMDWEWKLKEIGLCEFKATPQIEDIHVPMVHVSDDFDLLPA